MKKTWVEVRKKVSEEKVGLKDHGEGGERGPPGSKERNEKGAPADADGYGDSFHDTVRAGGKREGSIVGGAQSPATVWSSK